MNSRMILALVLALGFATSCVPVVLEGSGNLATESREVSGLRAVDLAGVGNLVIRQFFKLGQDECVPLFSRQTA